MEGEFFIMNNNMLWNVISKITFLVSAVFTIFLICSQANGFIEYILFFLMAVSMESLKYALFTVGLLDLKSKQMSGYVAVGMSCVLIALSIVASLSYMYNQSNSIKQVNTVMSDSYKRQQQLYDTKQQEIKALQSQINSLPRNYISKKSQLSSQLSKKSQELETINKGFSSVKVESSQGYTAFLGVIAEIMSKQAVKQGKEPITTEQLEVTLFTIISICFEILAVLSFYYYKKLGSVGSLENSLGEETKEAKKPIDTATQRNDIVENTADSLGEEIKEAKKPNYIIPDDDRSVAKQLIGFKLEKPKEVSDEHIRIYLENMYKSQKPDNRIDGYINISKQCGFTESLGRKIHGYLEKSNVVQVDSGTKTSYALKQLHELQL
jgi:hypothetical protein